MMPNSLKQHFGLKFAIVLVFAVSGPGFLSQLSAAGCGCVQQANQESQDQQSQENARQPVLFDRDIKPIFDQHCLACHGEEDYEVIRVDIKEDVLDYIEPGDADNSEFYELVSTDDEDYLMPPPDNDQGIEPLSAGQVATIKRWIDEGALWSGEMPAENSAEATEGQNPGAGDADSNDANAADSDEAPKELWVQIWESVGVFHPAVVHFPIALLIVSALFCLGSMRGSYTATDVAYYTLLLGTASAVVAAALGWSFTVDQGNSSNNWMDLQNVQDMDNKFFWHGISGLVLAVLSVIVSLMAISARRSDPDQSSGLWKAGTLLLAALVGFVGHAGGDLTYGDNLYDPVWEVVDRIRGGEPEAEGEAEASSEVDDQGQNGNQPEGDNNGDTNGAQSEDQALAPGGDVANQPGA